MQPAEPDARLQCRDLAQGDRLGQQPPAQGRQRMLVLSQLPGQVEAAGAKHSLEAGKSAAADFLQKG